MKKESLSDKAKLYSLEEFYQDKIWEVFNENQECMLRIEQMEKIESFLKEYAAKVVEECNTFEFDVTCLSKEDQLTFRMLINSGVKIKAIS